MPRPTSRKVTLSLPEDLVAFADAKAAERGTSRSHLVREMLADLRQREQDDDLAREGYRFFADEARAFADMSASAFAEVIADHGSTIGAGVPASATSW